MAKTKTKGLPSRRISILDRRRLRLARVNIEAGRQDLADVEDERTFLSGHAPRGFRIDLILERAGPWLWIGLSGEPANGPGSDITCYAVIHGARLREVAEAVLLYCRAQQKDERSRAARRARPDKAVRR